MLSGLLATPDVGVGIHDREGVVARSEVHAHLHDHPDDRARRRRVELQPALARQRRHVRGPRQFRQGQPAAQPTGDRRRERQSDDCRACTRRSSQLDDPATVGRRLHDDERRVRAARPHGGQRVHVPGHGTGRQGLDAPLLRAGAGRRQRAQGRHDRWRRGPGGRADPIPALLAAGHRDRLQRQHELLQPRRRRRLRRWHADQPDRRSTRCRACGSWSSRRGGPPTPSRAPFTLDGDRPRRGDLAEPRRGAVGPDRRAADP